MKREWSDEEIMQYRKEHKQNLFYYNKEDIRIMVPKFHGIGMTVNFARIMGLVILIGIIFLGGILSLLFYR